jgi:hypothetical protein
MSGRAQTAELHPLEEWTTSKYLWFMRPICFMTLHPNRPLLQTALRVLEEQLVMRRAKTVAGDCVAVTVRFDQPRPHTCVLVCWPDRGLAEYFDPNAPIQPEHPRMVFETCLRAICTSKWRLDFSGTKEIFGPLRSYSAGNGQLLRGRVFPAPQRAGSVFVQSLLLSGADHGRNKLAPALQQYVDCCAKMGPDAANLFWCLNVLQQATTDGCTLRTWVRTRVWYQGAVDYVTIGALATKHLIASLEAVVFACRRLVDNFPELSILR